MLTKKVWERIQKDSHFKTASNSFKVQREKCVWERRSHAFPPHYNPGLDLDLKNLNPFISAVGLFLIKMKIFKDK